MRQKRLKLYFMYESVSLRCKLAVKKPVWAFSIILTVKKVFGTGELAVFMATPRLGNLNGNFCFFHRVLSKSFKREFFELANYANKIIKLSHLIPNL